MVIVNISTSLCAPKVYFCKIKTRHSEEIISEDLEFINTQAPIHCLQNPHSLSDDKGSFRRQWAGSPEPMIHPLLSVLEKPWKNITGTHANTATPFPRKSKAVCHWKIQPRSQILSEATQTDSSLTVCPETD